MANKELRFRMIPASVVLNNFIKNEEESNYEIFLLEYLNKSDYFQNKSNNKKYVSPRSQSNGECDAISQQYEIDFKLLASASYLQGHRLTSNSITKVMEGVTSYGLARDTKKEYKVTFLLKLFEELSFYELNSIRRNEKNIEPPSDDYDVLKVLETMETKKNLLLFFPYQYLNEDDDDLGTFAKRIGNKLKKGFFVLSEYRKKVMEKHETYLVVVCDENFLLYSFGTTGFDLLEVFPTSQLPTYKKLWDYANPLVRIGTLD